MEVHDQDARWGQSLCVRVTVRFAGAASRNKILRPVTCDAPMATDAGEPRPTVLGRRLSALADQRRGARKSGVATDGGYLRAGFLNANSLKANIQEICQFLRDEDS